MKTELTPKPLLQRQLEQFLWDLCAYDSEFEAAIGDRNIDDVVKPYYEELISVKDEQKPAKDSPEGLFGKYVISRSDGSPIHPENEYFVLKLKGDGDPIHMEACTKAVLTYAEEIRNHLPVLANDLLKRYGPFVKLEQPQGNDAEEMEQLKNLSVDEDFSDADIKEVINAMSLLTKQEEQPQADDAESKDSGFWGRVASRQKDEIQSLKQANASLIECLRAISANSMDSWIIRMAVKELSKHDKQ